MTLKVEGRAVKRGQKRHHFESRFGPLGQILKSGPPRLVNTAVWFETKKDEQRCRSCPLFTALYDQLLLGCTNNPTMATKLQELVRDVS